MSKATNLYALGLEQVKNAILAAGDEQTVLVQGPMGSGKSSILKMLAKELPDHVPCYFDCTTKDIGDITVPKIMVLDKAEDGTEFVRFVPNEELGLHFQKPVILMIDEYGKANRAVQNAMLRIMQERTVGNIKVKGYIFATTNLGAEGVGDILLPHARNRITVVKTRTSTWEEWLEWGINNGIDYVVLGWVKEMRDVLFQSFEDIKEPFDKEGNPTNPYVFHPQVPMNSFVTLRSLEGASRWLKKRDKFDDQTLTSLLMGTIGERGGMDLMAHTKLVSQLPTLESIKKDPMSAMIPTSAAATAMVIFRALGALERDWVDAWVDYMSRLDKEAQGLFVNNVRQKNYTKQNIVLTNSKFTTWAMNNNFLFSADK